MVMNNDNRGVFLNQGFFLWPEPIDGKLLFDLQRAVASIQRKAQEKSFSWDLEELLLYEKSLSSNRRGGVSDDLVGESIFIIGDPMRFDGIFLKLLEDKSVVKSAKTLLGVDNVVVHFMNVTIKNPIFGRAIAWHRDYPNEFFCTRDSGFIRLMICLDGMSEINGATCFDISSHHISDQEAEQQKRNGKWPLPSERTSVLCCAQGQIAAIHSKVLHGGGMNNGDGERRNIIIQVGKLGAEIVTSNFESMTGTVL